MCSAVSCMPALRSCAPLLDEQLKAARANELSCLPPRPALEVVVLTLTSPLGALHVRRGCHLAAGGRREMGCYPAAKVRSS